MEKMTLKDLKAELKKVGAKVSGRKQALTDRQGCSQWAIISEIAIRAQYVMQGRITLTSLIMAHVTPPPLSKFSAVVQLVANIQI